MNLDDFQPFLAHLEQTSLAPWRMALADAIATRLAAAHGDQAHWAAALAALPALPPGTAQLHCAAVGLPENEPLAPETKRQLREALMRLHPWRKGPYCLCGVLLDTEWRSDWKWERLAQAIAPLAGRLVLDVGCGNGYHAWRMLGAGARQVLGIDPTRLFVAQFMAINRYLARDELAVLPLGIEDLPVDLSGFDTVFSLGVLYHRRSPMDHLNDLRRLLRPGGELVLETLVLDGAGERALVPPGRYAGMRNVWFVPGVEALTVWLGRCGFQSVRVIDVSRTTSEEQRRTAWMRFHSLANWLDPDDANRTIEGLPGPIRAILIAKRS